MNEITEKQASFIRSLAARIENKKPVAPKKVTRWNDPVKAHQQHLSYTRNVIAKLDAGELTRGAASTHIDSMIGWAKN